MLVKCSFLEGFSHACVLLSQVVTAGADETLRFWRAFGDSAPAKADKAAAAAGATTLMRSVNIR